MTVSLTNKSNRCQVFVLAHNVYCCALGECVCVVEEGRAQRRVPRSLTLTTGVTSPELDDAVLAIPDVVRAVRRGELAVKRHVAERTRSALAISGTPLDAPEVGRSPHAKKKRGAL